MALRIKDLLNLWRYFGQYESVTTASPVLVQNTVWWITGRGLDVLDFSQGPSEEDMVDSVQLTAHHGTSFADNPIQPFAFIFCYVTHPALGEYTDSHTAIEHVRHFSGTC